MGFVVPSLSCTRLFTMTPWTGAHQASLSSTASWSLLKFMSIESVLLSNHLTRKWATEPQKWDLRCETVREPPMGCRVWSFWNPCLEPPRGRRREEGLVDLKPGASHPLPYAHLPRMTECPCRAMMSEHLVQTTFSPCTWEVKKEDTPKAGPQLRRQKQQSQVSWGVRAPWIPALT